MRAADGDPIERLLKLQPVMILDGGLATELEARGVTLDTDLWSAALLVDRLETVREVHREYLEAGADCIVSATYQATVPGLVASGLSAAEAERAIELAVAAAVQVRDEFWQDSSRTSERARPLVAAGVGPYGAYLANGSEFTGDYDLNEDQLVGFHEARWRLLAGADLLVCETIPSAAEARALARLFQETPEVGGWISFSCQDGERISDGTELATVLRELADAPGLLAVGVNCTSPRHISSLLGRARTESNRPLVVYPNTGERWDSDRRCWIDAGEPFDLAAAAPEWVELGARVIGGCCRTTPADIARLRGALLGPGGAAEPAAS